MNFKPCNIEIFDFALRVAGLRSKFLKYSRYKKYDAARKEWDKLLYGKLKETNEHAPRALGFLLKNLPIEGMQHVWDIYNIYSTYIAYAGDYTTNEDTKEKFLYQMLDGFAIPYAVKLYRKCFSPATVNGNKFGFGQNVGLYGTDWFLPSVNKSGTIYPLEKVMRACKLRPRQIAKIIVPGEMKDDNDRQKKFNRILKSGNPTDLTILKMARLYNKYKNKSMKWSKLPLQTKEEIIRQELTKRGTITYLQSDSFERGNEYHVIISVFADDNPDRETPMIEKLRSTYYAPRILDEIMLKDGMNRPLVLALLLDPTYKEYSQKFRIKLEKKPTLEDLINREMESCDNIANHLRSTTPREFRQTLFQARLLTNLYKEIEKIYPLERLVKKFNDELNKTTSVDGEFLNLSISQNGKNN